MNATHHHADTILNSGGSDNEKSTQMMGKGGPSESRGPLDCPLISVREMN